MNRLPKDQNVFSKIQTDVKKNKLRRVWPHSMGFLLKFKVKVCSHLKNGFVVLPLRLTGSVFGAKTLHPWTSCDPASMS